jgi:hypothetical protein
MSAILLIVTCALFADLLFQNDSRGEDPLRSGGAGSRVVWGTSELLPQLGQKIGTARWALQSVYRVSDVHLQTHSGDRDISELEKYIFQSVCVISYSLFSNCNMLTDAWGARGRIKSALRSLKWFETDVSGLPIGSIFKGEDALLLGHLDPWRWDPTGSSETSVSNHIAQRKNPEDWRIQFNHGRSLRSGKRLMLTVAPRCICTKECIVYVSTPFCHLHILLSTRRPSNPHCRHNVQPFRLAYCKFCVPC